MLTSFKHFVLYFHIRYNIRIPITIYGKQELQEIDLTNIISIKLNMEKNIWPTNILNREKQSLLSSSQSSSLITEMFQNKKKLNDNNYSDNIEYIISESNMININYRVFSYMVGSQKQYVLVFIDRAKIYSHIEPILIILGREPNMIRFSLSPLKDQLAVFYLVKTKILTVMKTLILMTLNI